MKYLKQGGYRAKIDQKGPKSTKMVRTRRGLEAEVLRFFAATPQLAGLQTQHSWAMMAGFAPQTCTRTCCHLAAPFPASLLPGARFRAAHPPRPHVGSGVHRRGGLGWVKGRRAYESSHLDRSYQEQGRGCARPAELRQGKCRRSVSIKSAQGDSPPHLTPLLSFL